MFKKSILYCTVFLGLASFASCDLVDAILNDNPNVKDPINVNTPRPNPNTNTTTSKIELQPTQKHGNQVIKYQDFFMVSYSEKHKNPEWAAYTLTAAQRAKSDIERTGSFKTDKDNPLNTATNDDFTGSGYDRGHLVPCEDMSFAPEAMEASFFTTNVSPQDEGFNRGIWKVLENKVRGWADSEKKVYIVTGAVLPKSFTGATYIGKNKDVFVPKKFYKIILVWEKNNKKGIAFLLNNVVGEKGVPLSKYACSIDEVEQATGINFFPNLNADEDKEYEGKFDAAAWGL
jgi:endonuclease G, mitochondrial